MSESPASADASPPKGNNASGWYSVGIAVITAIATISVAVITSRSTARSAVKEEVATSGTAINALQEKANALKATTTQLAAATNIVAPIGGIMAFAGPRNRIPQGWRECDGSPVSRAKYPVLYQALQAYWGTGDSLTDTEGNTQDFNLPDLRGLFLRGVDDTGSIDVSPRVAKVQKDPKGVGSMQVDYTKKPPKFEIAGGEHSHGLRYQAVVLGQGGVRLDNPGSNNFNGTLISTTLSDGSHTHTTSGWDGETVPKNAAVFFIIRVE